MDSDNVLFSRRLKELRTKKEMTQKDLAEQLGLSAATIIAYEKAQKIPSLDIAKKMALFFNVSLDWISGITDTTDAAVPATCENAIIELSRLDNLLEIEIEHVSIQGSNEYGSYGTVYEGYAIIIPNSTIAKYLEDWKKMKDLLSSKSIDIDLYNLWLKKQMIDKKNIAIKRNLMMGYGNNASPVIEDDDLPF